LTDSDLVLWNPKPVFIRKLFSHCRRNRTAVELARAYMHYSWYSFEVLEGLWNVASEGLKARDYDGIQPFLILLQHMIEAHGSTSPQYRTVTESIMRNVFEAIIKPKRQYWQFMEKMTDFVIKIG